MQIATTRFLSLQGLDFSPHSKVVISRRFVHFCSLPHISTPHLPVLVSLPPWSLHIPSVRTLPDGIPLLPSEPDSLFLYLSATCLKQVANVSVVATDISGIIRFSNTRLSQPSSQRFASSFSARVAFDIILSLSTRYKSFSIFAPSMSFFIFTSPCVRLFQLEIQNLSSLASLATQCSMFYGLNAQSQGYILASFWANTTLPPVVSEVMAEQIPKATSLPSSSPISTIFGTPSGSPQLRASPLTCSFPMSTQPLFSATLEPTLYRLRFLLAIAS